TLDRQTSATSQPLIDWQGARFFCRNCRTSAPQEPQVGLRQHGLQSVRAGIESQCCAWRVEAPVDPDWMVGDERIVAGDDDLEGYVLAAGKIAPVPASEVNRPPVRRVGVQ